MVNPVSVARTVNAGYALHPDHKGAAEFIKALELSSGDIIVAEDVLQQTYDLGHVDYWLCEIDDARQFAVVKDGVLVDLYTETPILGTGEELESLLVRSVGRDVYVIGSGENVGDGVRAFRGEGIRAVLESDRFEVVHEGRDGLTKVLKGVR